MKTPRGNPDPERACRERILTALETLVAFDPEPAFQAVYRRRYLDLTNQKDRAA